MIKKLLTTIVLSVAVLTGCDKDDCINIKNPTTATKTLANGSKIPVLGFGTWKLLGENAYESVKSAIANGYRHIDTAFVYDNEVAVGQAIRDSGIPRDQIFITSKVPHYSKTYGDAVSSFEQTLSDLGTDYVDLYLIHWPVTKPLAGVGDNFYMENREVWRAMEDIYNSGRARAIGVSNFSIADIKNIMKVATVKPMVNQIKYHIGHTPDDIVKFCKRHDIVVEGYSTLGRGAVLTSLTVAEMAAKYKVSPAQIAIRYSLQKGVVPLVKAENSQHQIENREVDFKISHQDMKILEELEISSTNW